LLQGMFGSLLGNLLLGFPKDPVLRHSVCAARQQVNAI
jgi:hypothetical protein